MNTLGKIGIAVGIMLVAGVSIQAVQSDSGKKQTVKEKNHESVTEKVTGDYSVYALPLPEEIDFAGERVPLENPDIRERLDRELLVNVYWQSNGLLLFKRANKYFPLIEPLLEKYGLPDDFKYLAVRSEERRVGKDCRSRWSK